MDETFLLKNILEQFLETDLDLDPKVSFRNLDSWDSLTGMAIITMIEDRYSVKITDSEFRALNTFQDIINFVKQKIN